MNSLDSISANQFINEKDLKSMEMYDQNYGMIIYSTIVPVVLKSNTISFDEIHDRVQVFIGGKYQFTAYRDNSHQFNQVVNDVELGSRIDFLVENMGRINFGDGLYDRKGISKPVKWNLRDLSGYNVTILPLGKEIDHLKYEDASVNLNSPTFYRGEFAATVAFDSYLDFTRWTKGIVWINNFNLGRYWNVGPQKTLYIPADVLKKGKNRITILELDGAPSDLTISFTDTPIFK